MRRRMRRRMRRMTLLTRQSKCCCLLLGRPVVASAAPYRCTSQLDSRVHPAPREAEHMTQLMLCSSNSQA